MTRQGAVKLRPTPIRGGTKVRAVYDRAHLSWRAGVIGAWHYGRRSPEDSTIVWVIDGTEFSAKDLLGVSAAIETAMSRAGITHAVFGASWCGYRSLTITYIDGTAFIERFDSATGVVVRERVAAEVAA